MNQEEKKYDECKMNKLNVGDGDGDGESEGPSQQQPIPTPHYHRLTFISYLLLRLLVAMLAVAHDHLRPV